MTANADIAIAFLRVCARGEVRAAYERYVSADFVVDGKIVGLWDLGQEKAKGSPNALGMF